MIERTQFMTDDEIRVYFQHRRTTHNDPPLVVTIITGVLLVVTFPILLAVFLSWAWPEMVGHTWTGIGTLGGAAALIGAGAYWAREVREHWIYPLAEIAAGIAIATQAARPDGGPIVALIAFVAAVRIVIDGMTRFVKFRAKALEAKAVTEDPATQQPAPASL